MMKNPLKHLVDIRKSCKHLIMEEFVKENKKKKQ